MAVYHLAFALCQYSHWIELGIFTSVGEVARWNACLLQHSWATPVAASVSGCIHSERAHAPNLDHRSSPTQRVVAVPVLFQYRRQLHKADEIGLSTYTILLEGIGSAPQEKCPHPETGDPFSDRFAVAVLPHSLPSTYRPTGCSKSPIDEPKI